MLPCLYINIFTPFNHICLDDNRRRTNWMDGQSSASKRCKQIYYLLFVSLFICLSTMSYRVELKAYLLVICVASLNIPMFQSGREEDLLLLQVYHRLGHLTK